jgi:histidinol dehydrogenase
MRTARGAQEVRELLRRAPVEAGLLSPKVAEGIARVFGEGVSAEQAVDRIIAAVAEGGDEALFDYGRRIDGWSGASLAVTSEEIDRAVDSLAPELMGAMEVAAERIRVFHEVALPESWFDEATGLGQRILPLKSVGLYVPGGTASYPSTVLHTAMPAKVAGVESVIVTTPPEPTPIVLAAARIAGVDQLYRVGGAQAIAAMAFGTATIPRVDKIFGPGNLFVTIAKRKLYGTVGIDGVYGPTETLIIADETARAELCAADLLAQAEHDVLATPVLLTTSETLAGEVAAEVERQLVTLERRELASVALETRGLIGLVGSVEEAIELANEYAPEHLCLFVDAPKSYVNLVVNAGGLFLGESSPEVLGDYNAGPSHVMPTGGSARYASALNLMDFFKLTSVVGFDPALGQRLGGAAARIAREEGLTGHARAAKARLTRGSKVTR